MKRRLTVNIQNSNYDLEAEAVDGQSNRFIARGRIPVSGLMPMAINRSKVERAESASASNKIEADRAAGTVLLEGIASSTSVDWHGTEMTVEALEGMANQFRAGVPYVPSHHDDEWDQVFGKTISAKIEKSTVAHPALSNEPGEGLVLRVTTQIYTDDGHGKRLVNMIDRGQTIGMSIGGWFTDLEVVTNDDDEVERMLIRGVELDHLATTRRPSNPDSWISELVRSCELERAKKDEEEYDAHEDEEDMEDAEPDEDESEAAEELAEADAEEEGAEADESVGEEEHIGEEDEAHEEEQDVDDEDPVDTDAPEDEDEDEEDRKKGKKHEYSRLGPDAHRHVVKVEETDEHIKVTYGKSEDFKGMFSTEGEDVVEDPFDEVPEQRTASGSPSLNLAAEDTPWDWNTATANEVLDVDDWVAYRKAHFWYDPDAPEIKSSYKLPFAKMIDGDLKAVWRGVAAAMAALNGARGGVDIPESERQGVYERIAGYYSRFEKGDPPELRSLSEISDRIIEEGSEVDRSCSPGEHTSEGSQAHRSRPSVDSIPPKQEASAMSDRSSDDMTENNVVAPQISPDETRLAAIETALGKLLERGAPEPAAKVEPAETMSDAEIALRSKVEDLEKLVAKLANPPARRGMAHVPAARRMELTGPASMVRAVKEECGPDSALAAVAEAQAERRSAPKEQTPTRGQLEADLRAVLQAAMMDGYITDPDARNSWR
jgi:hypothetical protein